MRALNNPEVSIVLNKTEDYRLLGEVVDYATNWRRLFGVDRSERQRLKEIAQQSWNCNQTSAIGSVIRAEYLLNPDDTSLLIGAIGLYVFRPRNSKKDVEQYDRDVAIHGMDMIILAEAAVEEALASQ